MSELASKSLNTVYRDCIPDATGATGGRVWTARSEGIA
jgi:hypothetical protein